MLQTRQTEWTTKELEEFWQIKNKNTLYTTIKRYVKQRILYRIEKGRYSTRSVEKLLVNESKLKKARELVKKKKLLWYVKDYGQMSMAGILEAVLSYGSWNEVNQLIKLIGKRKLGLVYNQLLSQSRVNLRPETVNYFNLYFKKND